MGKMYTFVNLSIRIQIYFLLYQLFVYLKKKKNPWAISLTSPNNPGEIFSFPHPWAKELGCLPDGLPLFLVGPQKAES